MFVSKIHSVPSFLENRRCAGEIGWCVGSNPP
jgi:hypothetical protein